MEENQLKQDAAAINEATSAATPPAQSVSSAPAAPQATEPVPQAETPPMPETKVPVPPRTDNPVARASEALNESQNAQVERSSDEPNPVATIPFDMTQLSQEQLQTLKAMLNVTPERIIEEVKNPIVSLRKIDGKLVKDFKNAFQTVVFDAEMQQNVQTHKIPILLEGEEEYRDVMYADFMQAEQVSAKVVNTREEVTPVVEGQVVSKETGRLTEMVMNQIAYYLTVELPGGETAEIEAKIANA